MMRRVWMIRHLAVLVWLISGGVTLLPIPAVAITAEEMLADPTLESRARTLSKQLRCLVCQNQSIDDSDADLARDLRREVRSQLLTGADDDMILDQLRRKYGDYVLLNPPVDQATLVLWLAPVGFVLLGALLVIVARRQRQDASPTLDDDERARIKQLLTKHGHEGRTGK
jgi:cytochrome c-type biogenesis protein CcmH